MNYETPNEKYSGPSPNLNNKAKPMTFKSGMGFNFQHFKHTAINQFSLKAQLIQLLTNLIIFDAFMVNKYILTWCGTEMSFERMLQFGIHLSAAAL